MPGNKRSQVGDVAPGGLAENGKCRHRGGKQRRLRIAGKTKILFRPVPHHREKILAKRPVHLIEDGTRLGMGVSKRSAHAHGLRPLSGKLKQNFLRHEFLSSATLLSPQPRRQTDGALLQPEFGEIMPNN